MKDAWILAMVSMMMSDSTRSHVIVEILHVVHSDVESLHEVQCDVEHPPRGCM